MISNIKKYNYIQKKKLNNKIFKNINSKFKSICHETIKEIDDPRKTLNVLSQNFNLNFDIRDLMKFKNFKDIVVIGMGGSILGSEAIYSFLKKKIKKNIYFF